MQRLVFLLVLLLVLPAAGCRRPRGPKEGELVQRPHNPPVAYVADNDERLHDAAEHARKELPTFIEALDQPHPAQTDHAVKAYFEEGQRVEALWLSAVRFDGKAFHGVVANEPVHLKNLLLGAKTSVAADKVADWMLVDNGRLVGGWSIRTVRAHLPTEDRKRFAQTVPFSFD